VNLISLILVCASTACAAGPSSSQRVQTASANSNLSACKTFAFESAAQPIPPFATSARAFEVERRMRPMLEAELQGKGYVETTGDGKADFVVAFASGYAAVGGVPEGQTNAKPPVLTGQLVVDAFDATSKGQVWHGMAETEVDPQKIDDRLLQTALRRIMTGFPGWNAGLQGP
jgi:hypothetical protein